MNTETLEQMRARLDQYGAPSEEADFIVDLVAEIEKEPKLLPLHLMALAYAAGRMGLECTALLAVDAGQKFF